MGAAEEVLRDRTKAFAVRIVKLFRSLSHATDAQVLGKQLLRSGTGVAANYRAACRSRSRAEWVSRIGVVAEETDESVLWLELLSECGIVAGKRLESLVNEAHELTAIFTAARHTARTASRDR
jgi:four helix bundle protein